MKYSRLTLGIGLLTFLTLGAMPKSLATTTNNNAGINFFFDESPEQPVDPDNPDRPIVPTKPPTDGPLGLSYASDIQFGRQLISKESKEYYAQLDEITDAETQEKKSYPNFIQLTDKSGSSKGWELTVAQQKPFTNENGFELSNTKLTFKNIQTLGSFSEVISPVVPAEGVSIGGDAKTALVAKAENNAGQGTWSIQFGRTPEEASKSVSL